MVIVNTYKRYLFTMTIVTKSKGFFVINQSEIEVYAQSLMQAQNRLAKMGINAELRL